ncbi:hypothetical protein CALCODRAFT_500511 [Calocera cornea HHB12733]|uniref:Uncharacterized protein n=1 Tax=Calocera cornea HHB12733 TaxID=1353952 RepID=A0A165E2B2_9BASI|nr:hypothetical protein CALCODRAFT_500511 [Calocera cornea HHB12733]
MGLCPEFELFLDLLSALPSLKSLQYHIDDPDGSLDKKVLKQMASKRRCNQLEEVVRHGESAGLPSRLGKPS